MREVINPSDTNQRYTLFDSGRIDAHGGAVPTPSGTPLDTTSPWVNIGGPIRALQITDWVGPGGYVMDWTGVVTAFGTATAPPAQAAGVPFTAFGQPAKIAADMAMNPVGNGLGYILTLDGAVLPVGGESAVTQTGVTFSLGVTGQWGYRLVMQYSTKKYYVMTTWGSVLEGNGATGVSTFDGVAVGYRAPGTWWPFAYARGFAIYDWTGGVGWLLDGWGGVHAVNGAAAVPGGPYWQGNDYARDLNIVDDGVGPDPIILSVLDILAVDWTWTVSAAPTVDVVFPNATVTTTTRPWIVWDYNNSFDDAQASYVVRWFTSAQHGIGGFNPDSSPFTAEVSGTDPNLFAVRTPLDLSNTTWYAYVKVTSVANLTSAWDFISWLQNVTIPPAPTLTVTPGATNLDGISVTAHTVAAPGSGVLFGIQYMDADNPDQWRWVRGRVGGLTSDGSSLVPDGSHNATIIDDEPRYGVTRIYRAFAWKAPSGDIIASGPGAQTSGELDKRTDWTLIDPLDTTVDHGVVYLRPDVEWEEPVDSATFYGTGQADAIVMVDDAPIKSIKTTITFLLANQGEYDIVRPMVRSGRVLYLRDPFGRGWYVNVAGENALKWKMPAVPPEDCSDEDQPSGAGFYHQVDVPFIEVARPDTSRTDVDLDGLLASP